MKVLRAQPLFSFLVDLYRVPLVIKKVFEEVAEVRGDLSSSRAFSLPDDVAGSKVTNDNHESLKFDSNPFREDPFRATDVRLIESRSFGRNVLTTSTYV